MTESTPRLIAELHKLERTTASVSASMDKLLDHFGIQGVTEDEVDRVLADEPRATQGKRGTLP